MSGTDKSHAVGGGSDSVVPQKVQEKLPAEVEKTVPDGLHNTSGSSTGGTNPTDPKSTGVSHATGESKVPQGLQEAVPKGLEKALPDSIHPTS